MGSPEVENDRETGVKILLWLKIGTMPGTKVRAELSSKFLHLSTKTDGREL